MRRREFITLLGGAAAAWPLAARAQQPAMPVIGFLARPATPGSALSPLPQGLDRLGYVEGRTSRSSIAGRRKITTGCRQLAADLVRRQVALISRRRQRRGDRGQSERRHDSNRLHYRSTTRSELGSSPVCNRPGGNATGVIY